MDMGMGMANEATSHIDDTRTLPPDHPALIALLSDRGLRPTRTRRAVLSLLMGRTDHPSVDSLRAALSEAGHHPGQATLYQNLGRMAEAGIIRSFLDDDGVMRFDADVTAHPHVLCTECGRVDDVEPTSPEARRLERAASELTRARRDWESVTVRVEMRGVCPDCAAAR